ncbi:retinol dehydrogenase 12-like [Tubulanus polymorphus]|uniref:retinol dehydrogenase 12-like n=1 Tax=Tubulanus polymorphus TaxID=672921 RepID=UPI003DA4F846
MALYEIISSGVMFIAVSVAVYCTKKYMGGMENKCQNRLDGKTAVITGANTGIGKEVAKDLARRGARVILACRDVIRAKEAAEDIRKLTQSENVVFYKLDLASLQSVRLFVQQALKNEERVDILINNAGVMWCPRVLTDDGFEMQIGVNHLGHFLLTNLLLDSLKQAAPSRVINVTSVAYRWAEIKFDDLMSEQSYDPAYAYAQSKLANMLFTRELARRTKGLGVTTYAVHPGVVRTEIGRYMTILKQPIIKYLIFPLLLPIQWIFLKNPRQGAQTIIHCALAEELANESGKYYCDCKETKITASGMDGIAAHRLWEESVKLVGLQDQVRDLPSNGQAFDFQSASNNNGKASTS